MIKLIPALLLSTALIGCASTEELKLDRDVINAQIQMQSKPTLKLTCKGGCKFESFEYNDPSKKAISLPKRTNGADVAMKALEVIGGAVVPVIAGSVMKEAFSAVGTTYNNSHNQTATPTVVDQPAPLVVTQPDPTIVNPIVVDSPDPVIVNPVVVNPVIVETTAPTQ